MKQTTHGETVNVAAVTRELLDLIMKLPGSEKTALLERINPEAVPEATGDATPDGKRRNSPSVVTTALINAVMKTEIPRRCRILGELKAIQGSSRRKYSRINFFAPIQYVIGDRLSTGFIRNISVSGVFIEDPHYGGPIPFPGITTTMIFDHPHTGRHIKVRGTVARATKAGLGIRFHEKI